MENKSRVIPYYRKNKEEIAVIYVRGNNGEFQEMMCRLYASNKDYKVAYVTKHLKDVNLCDVLLVMNPARLSRDKLEYYSIVNEFNGRGIRVENAIYGDDANDNISFLMGEMFDKK